MNQNPASFFAEVILPIPVRQVFTYRIPAELMDEVSPGKRVIVQFGAKRFYSAVVLRIHNEKPQGFDVKEIVSVIDDQPVVNDVQLKFWDWIAGYYMCSIGDVMKAALPSGLKLESETKVIPNHDFETAEPLSPSEIQVLDMLARSKSMSVADIAKIYKKRDLLKIIKKLVDQGALSVEETIRESFKPKTETYVALPDDLRNDNELRLVFVELKRAPKQLQLLMKYIHMSGVLTTNYVEVSKKSLMADTGFTPEVLNGLVKKDIFTLYEKDRQNQTPADAEGPLKQLSDLQLRIYDQIKMLFAEKQVVLLHGYTSSGKTELYIRLIREQIELGRQTLYLLPEIALTAQIINRLKNVFGSQVGIYHSKFSDADRVGVWKNLLKGEDADYKVILGVRSSVFLPFTNLGLVIVDEEHENSYKQFDPAPRYHARDAAIVLAQMHNARVLLGTATPSIESYFNAENGKYGLVKLFQRYANMPLPDIQLANTSVARERKQMKSHFHPELIDAIKAAMDQGEQVLLFQNRRGYAPYFQCAVCHSIPKCKHCDVSLTYHKNINLLVCHYCGYTTSKINQCESCGNENMVMHGFGTEKVEDELALFFPGRRIDRMDMDSTRTRKAYEKIIFEFENGDIDIMVGTQMISKGLDFDRVNLVGILDADHLLNFPDFRAYERSFQLMAQVSGRAGRKHRQGKVIIQTSNPKNYILSDVIANDFLHMYRSQLEERYQFGYPPYTRLIRLTLKHKNQQLLDEGSEYFANLLRPAFGNRLFGPEYPLISRISNWYQKNILIKIERQASMIKAKEEIIKKMDELAAHSEYKSIYVQPDVDPM